MINIVLLQVILPCVAPVGRILVYVFQNNNQSINHDIRARDEQGTYLHSDVYVGDAL